MIKDTPFEIVKVESGPAVAWTDSRVIYIRGTHTDDETRVLIKHESAHIWLRHSTRRPSAAMTHDSAESRAWTMAAEVEIARGIYSSADVRIINAPRSSIAGGVVPTTLAECPHSIAEDVYYWLLDHPDELDKSTGLCGGCDHDEHDAPGENKQDIGVGISNISDLVSVARSKADAMDIARQAVEVGQRLVSYAPKVSIASELDALLASRLDRQKSYRRPSRRDTVFISAGRITAHTRPAVRIYVDRSGSFSPDKTASAQSALSRLLSKYGVRVKIDVLYFGNNRLSDVDFPGGGNTPYNLVADDIFLTGPILAIIITDDDQADRPQHDLSGTNIICIPCGASSTHVSGLFGGRDVFA